MPHDTLPERIWIDPDHWVERKPCISGYSEYISATALDAAHAERDAAMALLREADKVTFWEATGALTRDFQDRVEAALKGPRHD